MNKNMDRLAEIFCDPSFMSKVENYDEFEPIYAVVKEYEPNVTEDDLKVFLNAVAVDLRRGELDEESLESVAGGGFLAVCAGIGAVTSVISFSYKAGKAFGEFVRNFRGR